MKRIALSLSVTALFILGGCKDNNQKNLYLPETETDFVFSSVYNADMLILTAYVVIFVVIAALIILMLRKKRKGGK